MPPLLTLNQVRARDPLLAGALDGFQLEIPGAARDGHLANSCGPISFAVALYLRAHNLPGGLIHVTGRPSGFPAGTGHYMAVSDWLIVDLAYRQFDPSAPVPVLYARADLTAPPGRLRPWTAVSGELEWDDPLYPDFVEYPGNPPAATVKYVPVHLADPQWVTPWDDRLATGG